MPRFTLKPSAEDLPPHEFEAVDPSAALDYAGRNGFRSGDLLRDGIYMCTIRRAGEGVGGYWIVSQRRPEV